MIKILDKSNLEEQQFVLAHSSRCGGHDGGPAAAGTEADGHMASAVSKQRTALIACFLL